MKILITSEFYYPRVGGVELVVQKISEGLVALGHDVTVATTYVDNQPLILNGVRIEGFRIKGNLTKGVREEIDGEVVRYRDLLKVGGYDIVFQYAAQTWHVDLALDLLGVAKLPPFILAPCGFSGLTTWKRRIFYFNYFRALKKRLPMYHAVVPHSENYIDFDFCHKSGAKEVVVIPNGVDAFEFSKGEDCELGVRDNLGIPPNAKIVLSISNHFDLKGHRWLRKLSQLREFKNIAFVVVGGDPGGHTSCYSKCVDHDKKNQNFIVTGQLSNIQAREILKECSAFVLLSDLECFPLSVLEALAANKPVVTTRVGCLQSFSEKLMIVDRDLKHMSQALSAALKSSTWATDHQLESFLKTYSWERIVSQYEKLFLKVI